MMRKFVKFDETDRDTVRKWQITVIACYGTVLAAMVAVMIFSQAAGNWVASAAQAEMRTNEQPATTMTRVTETTQAKKIRQMIGLE